MKFKEYDLVIAGAGPGGITTAITFKKYNPKSKILIFDKNNLPQYKIGEVILPGSFEILKKIGIFNSIKKVGFIRKMGIYYFWGKSKNEGFLLPGNRLEVNKKGIYENKNPDLYSCHVDRYIYDDILLKEAKSLGIEFLGDTSIEVSHKNSDEIDFIKLGKLFIKGKFYVDSTGIYSGIISNKIKNFKYNDFAGDICYHGYLKGAKLLHEFKGLNNYTATTIGSYGNQCWFWYIPINNNLVSVGIVFKSKYNKEFIQKKNKEKLIIKILESKIEIKNAIIGSEFIKFRGLNKIIINRNWSGSARKIFGKNWILVGDSALFTDPIMSAGVTIAHRTGYYAGILLNNFFKTNNIKFKNLLLNTYEEYLNDFYLQFSNIIKFWYYGMDKNFNIEDLFSIGEQNLQKSGILDEKNHNNALFFYIINGLLQTLDTSLDEYSGGYEQLDYEILIKGLTGYDISIDGSNICMNDIYSIVLPYKITKKLRISGAFFKLFPYLEFANNGFFISLFIESIIENLDGKKTLLKIKKNNSILEENVKKDIKKLLLLGFIKKNN